MSTYSAVLIGLTGIGAARPQADTQCPLQTPMPRSHAAAYYRHPRTDLVAVCDLSSEKLDDFRRTWEDIWPQMHYYTDYRKMLDETRPDIASVATSDHAHADMVVEAAQGPCRAILCEKPIATTLEDADRMIAASEANDVLLSIEHTRRWDPLFIQARQLINSGELGPLRTMVCELFSDRAMLFRNGTHLIDLFNLYTQETPRWLTAELEPGFEQYQAYGGDGGRDPTAEPYASAYLSYSGGVRAFYNSYKTNFPGSLFTLTCDDGRIELSDRQAKVIRGTSHLEWHETAMPMENYLYTRQLGAVDELVRALEHGGELISPPREARKTLEIILGMLRSQAQGNNRINFPLS